MENSPEFKTPQLLRLVAGDNNVSGLLINLLERSEILVLMRISREIRDNLLKSPRAANKIYYETCLRADKSLLFSFYYEPSVQQYDREKLCAIYEHERLDWSEQLKKYNGTLQQLSLTLEQLVPGHAEAIVRDLAQSLREPDLPMPHLRHESVGTYCNSPFQLLLAELNWGGRSTADQWESQTYIPLKKKLIELAETLKQEVVSVDPHLLKTIRYRAETLQLFEQTNSSLLNLMQLLLQLVSNHLDGLVAYFSVLSEATPGTMYASMSTECSMSLNDRFKDTSTLFNPESPFEFTAEFVVRYRQFRNSMFEMEEKAGFVFQHFGLIFECLHPEYSLHPSCHLWRFMEKLWISKMRRFHSLTNLVYGQLFLLQLEDHTKRLVDLHETDCQQECEPPTDMSIFNNKIQLLYLKQKKPLSHRHAERKLGRIHPKSLYSQCDPECENQVFTEYTEYLVDISINEYNVHWCGSTKQRLGAEYRRAEKELIEVAQDYLRETYQIFDDVAVVKTIFEKTSQFIAEKVKAPTMGRIMKQAVEFLEGVRADKLKEMEKNKEMIGGSDSQMTMLLQWKLNLPDLSKTDLIVQYFNQQRRISQQTGEQFAMFFDLDKSVRLQTLQSLARDNSELGSQPQMHNIESYVSNDSTDLRQLQQPPRVNLSRMNSSL